VFVGKMNVASLMIEPSQLPSLVPPAESVSGHPSQQR
jgi:hypothetical protein